MIYLVDDKKSRQNDYGWTDNKLAQFKDIIIPIYTYDEMSNFMFRHEMFSGNNVVLIHESFFNNPLNKEHKKNFENIREKMFDYSLKNPHLRIVFFSGSIASRKENGNVAYMPVRLLYQNLEVFASQVKKDINEFRFLFFGKNSNLEKDILNKLQLANNNLDTLISSDSKKENLYIRPTQDFIQNPLEKFDNKFTPSDVDDSNLNNKIQDWLTSKKYDNIFIPLCFGPTLSDFNGLRLATLIRCSKNINQLSNIFIYGFVDMKYFYENEYFNILMTKNVELIDYKRIAFKESIEKNLEPLTLAELPKELNKIQLEVPDNFEDNHSIANEFGVYQLTYNAGIDISELTDFDSEKLNTIYFKWLIAKNGLYEELTKNEKEKNEVFRSKIRAIELKFTGEKIDLSKF